MLHSFLLLRPSFQSIILQIIAAVIAYSGVQIIAGLIGFEVPVFWQMTGQGLIAFALSILLKLPWWWCFIQLVFGPLVVLALALQLPGWLYLVGFFLLVFVFWNSADDRVPLYLTNQHTDDKLALLIGSKQDVAFVDLGSGFGGTILSLARQLPTGNFSGVETARDMSCFSLSLKSRSRATGRKDISVMQATSVAVLILLKVMYFHAI